jgi:hypothetical protein
MAAADPAVADAPHAVVVSSEVPVGAEDRSGSTARRSRIRQPKEPRWVTAGRERRGRLK